MPQREIVKHTGAGAERVQGWVLKNQADNYDAERFSAFEEKTREGFVTSIKRTLDRIDNESG